MTYRDIFLVNMSSMSALLEKKEAEKKQIVGHYPLMDVEFFV